MVEREQVWEIDFFRGIALVLMIFFHVLFDLKEFYSYPVTYNAGIYDYLGKVSVILFILISAISSSFSRNNVRRGLKYLAVGMLITVVSHLYNPDYGIKYGILHFLGTSILLFSLFRNLNKYFLLILGTIIIILGQYLNVVPVSHNYLFLFNLTSSTWISSDYYPLFPWFGLFLYGTVLGKLLYPVKRSLFSFTPRKNVLSFLGQHTLSVYLIHQPLLLLLLGLFMEGR